MNLLTLISELWRFFIENLKKILGLTILLALVIVGIAYGVQSLPQNHLIGIQDEPVSAEQLKKDNERLSKVYTQEPAEFQFVVSDRNGEIIENSYIFDEYFSSPEVVKDIKENTGIDISKTIQAEKDFDLLKTQNYRGSIAAIRDLSSSMITLRVLVGESKEENLKVARYLQSLLENDEVAIVKGLTVSIVTEAENKELLNLQEISSVPTEGTLAQLVIGGTFSPVTISILGVILGFLLATVFVFIFHFFGQTIRYGFDYTVNFEDSQVIINPKKTKNLVEHLNAMINSEEKQEGLVLSEVDLGEGIQKVSEGLNPETAGFKSAMLFIQTGKTSKQWYRQMRDLLAIYDVPVRIVQINGSAK